MSTESKGKFLSILDRISGFIALATVIFTFGIFIEQLRSLNIRVDKIESVGSPGLNEHLKEDTATFNSHDKRIDRLEATVLDIPSRLSKIETSLNFIEKKLDKP